MSQRKPYPRNRMAANNPPGRDSKPTPDPVGFGAPASPISEGSTNCIVTGLPSAVDGMKTGAVIAIF